MKITKLNGRYNANKKWGFTYSVTFAGFEWRKFYAVKAQAEKMFGNSIEMKKSFLWRDDIALLRLAPWAYHYERTSKPMFVYFRTEEQMEQCLVMFALTNTI